MRIVLTMFHVGLFAILSSLFCLFAFSAVGADQFMVAIPAALIALWLADRAFRSGQRVWRKRWATGSSSKSDWRQ